MKKLLGLFLLIGVTATVYADNARTKTGAALTYLLNGSPQYKGTIVNSDAGFTQNSGTITTFNLDDTSLILTQCDSTAFVCNGHIADGGCTAARSIRVETDEKFLVGALQKGVPIVAARAWDAGSVNCKVFELK